MAQGQSEVNRTGDILTRRDQWLARRIEMAKKAGLDDPTKIGTSKHSVARRKAIEAKRRKKKKRR